MIEVEDVRSWMARALEEDVKGGSILVRRDAEDPTKDRGMRFAERVPASKAKADALAVMLHSTIRLDWEASGKKNPFAYVVQIRDREQVVQAERHLSLRPEPVTVEQIQNQALSSAALTIQAAQVASHVPFGQLETVNGMLMRQLEQAVIENGRLSARVKELEHDRGGAIDQLVLWRKQEADGVLNSAQAEAIRAEGEAKARLYADLGRAALGQAPQVLRIAAGLAGLKIPGAPPSLGTAPPPVVGAPAPKAAYTPAAKPISDATETKIRAFAASLSKDEVARLCKFAWDTDPDGQILLRLIEPAHVDAMFDCLKALGAEWGI